MHKIGFLAFLGLNYGSILQSCALYEAINKLGHDCEVIDCGYNGEFIKEYPQPDPSLKADNPALYKFQMMKKNFHSFISGWFKFNKKIGAIPDNAILDNEQNKELENYGAFICGSDQIWKPHHFWFCAKRYLQFAPAEKRIAYAPSVCWKEIPAFLNMRKPQWGEWISSVRYLSTRETSSSALISRSIGRKVETVLDPTLLLGPGDWERLMPQGKYSGEIMRILSSGKPYLLAYLLDSLSEKHLEYIRAIAGKLELEIIWLTGRDTVETINQNCVDTDPAGFVNLIRNASFVCMDGFHGTCFSLNFSRPFFVFKKDGDENDGRIRDLLQRVGADDRIVNVDAPVNADDLKMDYGPVQEKLDKERKKSLEWLRNAIEGAIHSRGPLHELTGNEIESQKLAQNENYENYHAQLQDEQNFYGYLEKLGRMEGELVVMAARDTISPNPKTTNIGKKEYDALKKLGFNQLGQGAAREFWAGYIAIKYKQFVVYEQLAPSGNSLATELNITGLDIKVTSSPGKAFNFASIKIDDQEYAVNQRGLNIVTFDPFHKKLVDSVCFDAWHKHIPALRDIRENNFYNYVNSLKNHDDTLIVMAARDTISPNTRTSNISDAEYEALSSLGLNRLGHGSDNEFWAGYIAVIYNHKLVFEELAPRNEKLVFAGEIEGLKVNVSSSPYKSGNIASIKINDREYAVNKRGLNIVVFDARTRTLLDTVAFDSWRTNIPAQRNAREYELFKYIELGQYLEKVASRDAQLVVFAAKDTISQTKAPMDTTIQGGILKKLEQLGLKAFGKGAEREFWAGYVSVIYRNKVIFEKLGEYGETVSYAGNMDGVDLKVVSSPYNAENIASIKINGSEYAVNQRGLNIAIFDTVGKRIKDSVAFDTWQSNVPCQRNFIVNVKNVAGRAELELSNSSIETAKKVNSLYSSPEFYKVKMIAALLRDYNIRHVVLSSGTRHAPLVRMFENNRKHFTLHSVVDERSAGYFALGLASELKEPVVCVCTSGTAASNYLPPVTEAFYTGIPLIMVTTDRMAFLLNHGEDQTIPQRNIYAGVVKKSVTLPEGDRKADKYQTQRDVADCILESTHHTPGPVHINLAIENAWIGGDVPAGYWQLNNIQPNPVQPHIERVEVDNDHKDLWSCLETLKNSKRIMLVYGQSTQPSPAQLDNIGKFSTKYNCVILTDLISNLYSSHTLQPFNMLSRISQKEFDDKFAPDILISVGGKRLMNDPLTDKIRNSSKQIQHWDVNPDGRFKDFYFRLSKVMECSRDYFFDWFANHGSAANNDDEYFALWKKAAESYGPPESGIFDSHYIQGKFLPAIPPNSLLHLGVGLSFYFTRRYTIDPTVEVYCNMGSNGIDGCTSTFMGACAAAKNRLGFLLVGDLSFFYDMNSIWNKRLNKNIRILLVNNNGSDLLRYINLKNITCVHDTSARAWAEAAGFEYLNARNKEEFDARLQYFVSDAPQKAVFFEAMYNFG